MTDSPKQPAAGLLMRLQHLINRVPKPEIGMRDDPSDHSLAPAAIRHFSLAIHRPPQIHALAIDRHEHFVQVPPGIRSRTGFSELGSISPPEL